MQDIDAINSVLIGGGSGRRKQQSNDALLFGSSPKQQPQRDPHRTFSQSQKNEVLQRQKHRCAKCHDLLNVAGGVEYDHIKPWEKGGKTIASNCQALCRNCHGNKSHKATFEKVEKKRAKRNDTPPDSGMGLYGGLGIPKTSLRLSRW